MTFKKADYILDFAEKVQSGIFDIKGLDKLTDEEVIKELSALKGIGVWTAEMIMTCFQLWRSGYSSGYAYAIPAQKD